MEGKRQRKQARDPTEPSVQPHRQARAPTCECVCDCVAAALPPMKAMDMKGEEESVTRIEGSWLRSSMSQTSRLPLWSVR